MKANPKMEYVQDRIMELCQNLKHMFDASRVFSATEYFKKMDMVTSISVKDYLDEIKMEKKVSEAPQFRYIAILLYIVWLCKDIDKDKYIHKLIRALNYWGFYDLIEEIVANHCNLELYSTNNILILQQYAKSVKNHGDLEKALNIYRKILQNCKKISNKILSSYMLTLYANFCYDYLQRTSQYYAYCNIAYFRIKDIETRNMQEKRWKQIVFDTYAKSISSVDINLSQKIFEELINSTDNFEVKCRLKFRKIETFVLYHIEQENVNIGLLYTKLDEYLGLLNEMGEINLKAFSIRTLRMYKLIRLIEYYRERKSLNRPSAYDIYFYDKCYVLKKLDSLAESANYFRDNKTYAEIYLEKALWIKLLSNNENIKQSLKYLQDGRSLLLYNCTPITTDLYFKILIELADTYRILMKEDEASSVCKELFNFLDTIRLLLGKEIESINNGNNENVENVEFSLLKKEEVLLIKNSIMKDYQSLADKMSFLCQRIGLYQTKTELHKLKIIVDSTIHDTSNDLNKILNICQNSISNENQIELIRNYINHVKDRLYKLRKNLDDKQMVLQEFDIVAFSKRKLEDIMKELYSDTKDLSVCFQDSPRLLIKFDQVLLSEIYVNIIDNISTIMTTKKKNKEINIIFSTIKKEGIIYLTIVDNCGNINKFKDIIASVNNDNGLRNLKVKGNGLKIIKQRIALLTHIEYDWELVSYSKKKKLLIPINRYSDEL